MAATCLVCGERAGSKEHLFPAVLGGRETSKKVYCSEHNQLYGNIISVLNDQLRPLNVQLGVVSDNRLREGPQAAVVELPGLSAPVAVSMASSTLQAPVTQSVELLGGGAERHHMRFADQQQADAWIAELRRQGLQVRTEAPAEAGTMVQPSQIPVRITLGGERLHACLAYIAQTYFAMLLPPLARDAAFTPFVRYTEAYAQAEALERAAQRQSALGEAEHAGNAVTDEQIAQANQASDAARKALPAGGFVRWTAESPTAGMPNAFEFGHRVLIGMDATDGQVYAHVSLFSTLHYTIGFGRGANVAESREVCTDIDPLALHRPHDVVRTPLMGATHRVASAHIHSEVQEADLQCLIAVLQARMYRHTIRRIASDAIVRLDEMAAPSTSAGDVSDEHQRTREFVKPAFWQLVWNQVQEYVTERKKAYEARGRMDAVRVLASTFAFAPSTGTGMTPAGERFMNIAFEVLTAQMVTDRQAGQLTVLRLTELLADRAGVAIIGAAISPGLNSLVGE